VWRCKTCGFVTVFRTDLASVVSVGGLRRWDTAKCLFEHPMFHRGPVEPLAGVTVDRMQSEW
jgi:hypothetical protein